MALSLNTLTFPSESMRGCSNGFASLIWQIRENDPLTISPSFPHLDNSLPHRQGFFLLGRFIVIFDVQDNRQQNFIAAFQDSFDFLPSKAMHSTISSMIKVKPPWFSNLEILCFCWLDSPSAKCAVYGSGNYPNEALTRQKKAWFGSGLTGFD